MEQPTPETLFETDVSPLIWDKIVSGDYALTITLEVPDVEDPVV
jgi:hypothetical protein